MYALLKYVRPKWRQLRLQIAPTYLETATNEHQEQNPTSFHVPKRHFLSHRTVTSGTSAQIVILFPVQSRHANIYTAAL